VLTVLLEVEFHTELQLPSKAECARDHVKVWIGNIPVGRIPGRRIEHIETLEAKLESVPFIDREFFEKGKIEVPVPIRTKRIAAEIAE
jgi:hypothetical protein